MSHADTTLDLPVSGVVLLTGLNGAGKTALIEAVAVGLWGTPLRGTSPWPTAGGRVEITASDLWAHRSRGAQTRQGLGKQHLQWALTGAADPGYESAAKAHAALGAVLGPADLWARTHVFARRDAAAFAGATDGERKRLLEALLGLSGFDPAAKACREQLSAADKALAVATARVQSLIRAADDLRTRIARTLAVTPPEAPAAEDVEAARATYLRESAGLPGLSSAVTAARNEHGAAMRHQQTLAQRARQSPTECPTCRRPFDGAADAAAHLAQECKTAAESVQTAADALGLAVAAENAERARIDPLRAAVADLEARTRAAAQGDHLRSLVAEDEAALERINAEGRGLEADLASLTLRRDTLTATAQVLGLGGVRGHLLAHALPIVAQAATGWLARFGRPAWGFDLKATGDALTVDLTGAPHGHGYRGLSEGEKKRVDLALLLALGDLTASAQGRAPGTLWFDEALDPPLDAEGAAQVGEALRELAEGENPRAVVVIAHSPDVALYLRPDVHYSVVAGTVTRVH